MNTESHIRQSLKEYSSKEEQNSLRELAKKIGIGKTTLSEFLNSSRSLSQKNFKKICQFLNIDEESIEHEQQRLKYRQLASTEFNLISDWEYLAILNLEKVSNHLASIEWIAERLGLTQLRVKRCLRKLQEHGHLKIENGKLIRLVPNLTSTTDIPQNTIKKHHLQALHLAEDALFNTDVSQREFLSATMAIRNEELPKIKDEIFEIFKRFSKRFDNKSADEVYKFNIQFHPCKNHEKL